VAEDIERGIGKCAQNHLGSYGYPTRPAEPYNYCPACGNPMIWRCPDCEAALPGDPDELKAARFCRDCGASYFGEDA